jgi:hypothetical protein
MHAAGGEDTGFVHRNLTAMTIRVRHDGTSIFTGFHLARIPFDVSVASTIVCSPDWEATAAPEVRAGGLAAADQRSDIYSLCAALLLLFHDHSDNQARQAKEILQSGMPELPVDRKQLDQLDQSLAQLLGRLIPPPTAPPARFWTEDQVIRFRDHEYRIVIRLGSGGVGTTFKVVKVVNLMCRYTRMT